MAVVVVKSITKNANPSDKKRKVESIWGNTAVSFSSQPNIVTVSQQKADQLAKQNITSTSTSQPIAKPEPLKQSSPDVVRRGSYLVRTGIRQEGESNYTFSPIYVEGGRKKKETFTTVPQERQVPVSNELKVKGRNLNQDLYAGFTTTSNILSSMFEKQKRAATNMVGEIGDWLTNKDTSWKRVPDVTPNKSKIKDNGIKLQLIGDERFVNTPSNDKPTTETVISPYNDLGYLPNPTREELGATPKLFSPEFFKQFPQWFMREGRELVGTPTRQDKTTDIGKGININIVNQRDITYPTGAGGYTSKQQYLNELAITKGVTKPLEFRRQDVEKRITNEISPSIIETSNARLKKEYDQLQGMIDEGSLTVPNAYKTAEVLQQRESVIAQKEFETRFKEKYEPELKKLESDYAIFGGVREKSTSGQVIDIAPIIETAGIIAIPAFTGAAGYAAVGLKGALETQRLTSSYVPSTEGMTIPQKITTFATSERAGVLFESGIDLGIGLSGIGVAKKELLNAMVEGNLKGLSGQPIKDFKLTAVDPEKGLAIYRGTGMQTYASDTGYVGRYVDATGLVKRKGRISFINPNTRGTALTMGEAGDDLTGRIVFSTYEKFALRDMGFVVPVDSTNAIAFSKTAYQSLSFESSYAMVDKKSKIINEITKRSSEKVENIFTRSDYLGNDFYRTKSGKVTVWESGLNTPDFAKERILNINIEPREEGITKTFKTSLQGVTTYDITDTGFDDKIKRMVLNSLSRSQARDRTNLAIFGTTTPSYNEKEQLLVSRLHNVIAQSSQNANIMTTKGMASLATQQVPAQFLKTLTIPTQSSSKLIVGGLSSGLLSGWDRNKFREGVLSPTSSLDWVSSPTKFHERLVQPIPIPVPNTPEQTTRLTYQFVPQFAPPPSPPPNFPFKFKDYTGMPPIGAGFLPFSSGIPQSYGGGLGISTKGKRTPSFGAVALKFNFGISVPKMSPFMESTGLSERAYTGNINLPNLEVKYWKKKRYLM